MCLGVEMHPMEVPNAAGHRAVTLRLFGLPQHQFTRVGDVYAFAVVPKRTHKALPLSCKKEQGCGCAAAAKSVVALCLNKVIAD